MGFNQLGSGVVAGSPLRQQAGPRGHGGRHLAPRVKEAPSTKQTHLGVRVPNQPVVELHRLNKVVHGDPLVEPVEPLGVALGDEGGGEPGEVR